MAQRKRLGIPSEFHTQPLIQDLSAANRFEIITRAPENSAHLLRHRSVEAAFLTPIEYARECSEYRVVPDIAITCRKANEAITVHFREGMREVATLAADPSRVSEIVLATIILNEEFGVRPRIVPMRAPLEEMLRVAQSALLAGDVSLRAQSHANKIDLVDFWADISDMPYVVGFWCGREDGLSADDIGALRDARDRGVAALGDIAAATRESLLVLPYLASFDYTFAQEVSEGIQQFFQYAYYHGILPDVPDLSFYSLTRANDNLLGAVSPN